MSVLRRDPSWGKDASPYGPTEALTLERPAGRDGGGAATTKDPLGGRFIPGSRADLIVLAGSAP